jgi:hypothetical protein
MIKCFACARGRGAKHELRLERESAKVFGEPLRVPV